MFKTKKEMAMEVMEGITLEYPEISISRDALIKTEEIINQCTDEVGWLGLVKRTGNHFDIYDVILLEQEVTAVTTDIEENALENLAMEFMNTDRFDELNNIKMWGHSHVNMNVFASGTDEETMKQFVQGNPYFIRFIGNKKGDMQLDLFDYERNIIFKNLTWSVYDEKDSDMEHIMKEFEQLDEWYNQEYQRLESLYEQVMDALSSEIALDVKREVMQKVKEAKIVNKGWTKKKNTTVTTNYTEPVYNRMDVLQQANDDFLAYWGVTFGDAVDMYEMENDELALMLGVDVATVQLFKIDVEHWSDMIDFM